MAETPIYKNLTYWVNSYGKSGAPDERGIHDFMECENTETINSLRSELQAVSEMKYKNELMDVLLGAKRRVKHGSFAAWAKLMLLWMAGYKG